MWLWKCEIWALNVMDHRNVPRSHTTPKAESFLRATVWTDEDSSITFSMKHNMNINCNRATGVSGLAKAFQTSHDSAAQNGFFSWTLSLSQQNRQNNPTIYITKWFLVAKQNRVWNHCRKTHLDLIHCLFWWKMQPNNLFELMETITSARKNTFSFLSINFSGNCTNWNYMNYCP